MANSSDQTRVPEGMLGAKAWLATVLAVSPAAVAIALMVRFEATRNGARYCRDEVLGALLSMV